MRTYLLPLTIALLFAGCATTPPPPPPEESPPVEITESAPPVTTPMASPTEADSSANPDAPQKPAQTDTGRFRIAVASLDNVDATKPWVQKAEAAGYRTEILEVVIDGKSWQRVLLPGYASLAEAQAALPFIQQELGAPGAWVTSRRRAPTPEGAAAPAPPPPPPPAPAEDIPAPPAPPPPEQPAN